MRLEVHFGVPGLQAASVQGRLVAVIDVLRASTVVAVALANGARAVVPVESSDEVITRSKSFDRSEVRSGPFGIDDELEGIELLMACAETVESAPPELGQRRAGRMGEQAQVREPQGEHVVATTRTSVRDKLVRSKLTIPVEALGGENKQVPCAV